MRLLIEILAVYSIYAFGTSLLIFRYGTKDRVSSVVVAWLAPAIVVASFISFVRAAISVCLGGTFPVDPCPEGLAEAERIVERHRHQMFGGEMRTPHFAADWAKLYELAVEQEAARVQRVARKLWARPHASLGVTEHVAH